MVASRLFQVAAENIFEHPPHLSQKKNEMPLGPLDGWECYCLDFRDKLHIIGPFDPIIQQEDTIAGPFIEVTCDFDRKCRFWYRQDEPAPYNRPCWYQSGHTLRFIRKREPRQNA